MEILDLSQLKNIPVSITMGSFDGVHRGHAGLLDKLAQISSESGSRSLLITFDPHPRKIVDPDYDLKLINTKAEKLKRLELSSPDFIHFINFTAEFSKISYKDFYEKYILDHLDVKFIIAGSNHFFGEGRKGNRHLLTELCEKRAVKLVCVDPVHYLGKNISSTRIRKCICDGNIEDANSMLGYTYCYSGTICRGKGIGRKIGFPTANIELKTGDKIVPGNGVYFVSVKLENTERYGIANIGCSPTFGCSFLTLEAHIFDFDENIYGKNITVSFIKKLRNEKKFSSLDELKSSLEQDKAQAFILSKTIGAAD